MLKTKVHGSRAHSQAGFFAFPAQFYRKDVVSHDGEGSLCTSASGSGHSRREQKQPTPERRRLNFENESFLPPCTFNDIARCVYDPRLNAG